MGDNIGVGPILVFGPQLQWTPDQLLQLHSKLAADQRFTFLRECLTNLADVAVWNELSISLGCSAVTESACQGAQQLKNFAIDGSSALPITLGNTVLAALTVIEHTISFIRKADELSLNNNFPESEFPLISSAQGFCVGFLTAAAVTVSHNWDQFTSTISKAVRLALCIGAVIDGEEKSGSDATAVSGQSEAISVRWKTDLEKSYIDACIELFPDSYISCITDEKAVTITARQTNTIQLLERFTKAGVSTVAIGLKGRYHDPKHQPWADTLNNICAQHPDILQLSESVPTKSTLRSTIDGQVIKTGSLSSIATNLILSSRANWLATVKLAYEESGGGEIVRVGRGAMLPRNLSTAKASHTSAPSIHGQEGVEKHADIDGCGQYERPNRDEIAVVGMACRYPHAESLDEFWNLLSSGGTALQQISTTRFDGKKVSRGPSLAYLGNFLRDPDAFDHKFFGISGREAKSMDPQQRLALQVAYEALESSGYCSKLESFKEKNVGCYLGVGSVDYEENVASEDANAYSALGTLRAFISGRISHFFGWSGPSLTLDTACSSSIVAVHSACQALLADECAMALSGGVNVITNPTLYQNLAAANFLNKTGSSKAFDKSANGYCRGEGAGILVLKRLSRAVADGDPIFGIISGSAVNQGSNRSPIMVPDSSSQVELYKKCLSAADISAEQVTYVEAHGTGTAVGDPIEYNSVQSVFAGPSREHDLYLGSVKDNIGHTEAASGVAGVIKTLLMMHYEQIPAQANFSCLNPKIQSSVSDRIKIARSTIPWQIFNRVALVNNYGAAGSNAAVVLRQHVTAAVETAGPTNASTATQTYPIMLSARSEDSLRSYASSLAVWFDANHRFERKSIRWLETATRNVTLRQNCSLGTRATFNTSSYDSLVAGLRAIASGANVVSTSVRTGPVVLCFGGQTGISVSISRGLYDTFPVLQKHLNQCNDICIELGLMSIFPAIFEEEPVEDLTLLHGMLFSLQYSSARCWIDCGIIPDIVVGHSFGQLTALCVAGTLSLKDAMFLVTGRAKLIQDCWLNDPGCMIAVECNHNQLQEIVEAVNDEPGHRVAVACDNGANSFVLAGDEPSIDRVTKFCHGTDEVEPLFQSIVKTTRLRNSHAYHSHMMDSVLPGLRKLAESVELRLPSIPVETCTVKPIYVLSAEDIVRHTRDTVCFGEAIKRIVKKLPNAVWLEAGSATPIISMVRRVANEAAPLDSGNVFISVDLRQSKAFESLANAATQFWKAGAPAHYWSVGTDAKLRSSRRAVILPPYQFEKTKHWIHYKPPQRGEIALSAVSRKGPSELVSLKKSDPSSGLQVFSVDIDNPLFDLGVKGHAVGGHGLCPASMYVELAIQCALKMAPALSKDECIPRVAKLSMHSPLGLGISAVEVSLRQSATETAKSTWEFTICSVSGRSSASVKEHAAGSVSLLSNGDPTTDAQMKLLRQLVRPSRHALITNSMNGTGMTGSMIYKAFSQVVNYATYYQRVANIFGLEDEAAGVVRHKLRANDGVAGPMDTGVCDPLSIDNFLQVLGIHVNCLTERKAGEVYMCTSLDEITFSPEFSQKTNVTHDWKVYTRYTPSGPGVTVGDIFVFEADTDLLVLALIGVNFRSVQFKSVQRALDRLTDFKNEPIVTELSKCDDDSGYQSSASASTDSAGDITKRDLTRKAYYEPSQTGSVENTASSHINSSSSSDKAGEVRQMLMEVLELDLADITPTASLEDLGIDSLMTTEIVAEIRERLGVRVSTEELQEIKDVAALCQSINERLGVAHASRDTSTPPPTSKPPAVPEVYQHKSTDSFQLKTANNLLHSSDYTELSASDTFYQATKSFDYHANYTGFSDFYNKVHPLQSALVAQYVIEALANLGCNIATFEPGDPIPLLQYDNRHEKLKPQLFRILEDAGLIALQGDQQNHSWTRTATPVGNTSAIELHQRMLAEFPQHTSETKLLHTTAASLSECLEGSADPLSLLFRDATARALLQDVYTNAPMFKAGTLMLAQYLSDLLRSLASRSDSTREVKILELGAGTGGTTGYLLERLSNLLGSVGNVKVTYTFTDLSPSLVAAAKKKFAAYSFMEYTTLNIEEVPATNMESAYDIILSTNCIHATRNLVRSTANIHKMLRPDGVLCLIELTRNLYWFDLVFGLLEGWWLFNDGRKHVLANEGFWKQSLQTAGFKWVDWSKDASSESDLLRLIVASPKATINRVGRRDLTKEGASFDKETLVFKEADNLQLKADLYYPQNELISKRTAYSIGLIIHGGGHIMLSRNDIRLAQVKMLLAANIVPVSIDYRLCPEVNLIDGPMTDVCDALAWARNILPIAKRRRQDITLNGNKIVVVGWSTGGTLALSLGWTSIPRGIKPPEAILAFYCPIDYEDEHWKKPNIPVGSEEAAAQFGNYDLDRKSLREGVFDQPVLAYNVPNTKNALGGWLSPSDARSRIALYMNWQGKTLDVLLDGISMENNHQSDDTHERNLDPDRIAAISPLAQMKTGRYSTPTFIIHPRQDDLIPWQQAQHAFDTMKERNIEVELRIIEGEPHLFDLRMEAGHKLRPQAANAIEEGYKFLASHV